MKATDGSSCGFAPPERDYAGPAVTTGTVTALPLEMGKRKHG